MTLCAHIAAGCIATSVLLPLPSPAQNNNPKADAKDCSKAAKILEKGHPEKKEAWAYATIIRCPDGASVIGAAWNPPPRDPAVLHDLAARSRNISDSRVVTGALGAMQNAQLPQATRRLAMETVIAQFDPTQSIGSSTWNDPEHAGLAGLADHYQVPGEQPVSTADRQRILDAFRAMSQSDPDPQIRRVSARVLVELTR